MKLMNMIMIDCLKATRLVSESIDSIELNHSFKERLKLYIHLAICKSCNNYKVQIINLHNAFKSNSDKQIMPNLKLAEETEKRIQAIINGKLNENHNT